MIHAQLIAMKVERSWLLSPLGRARVYTETSLFSGPISELDSMDMPQIIVVHGELREIWTETGKGTETSQNGTGKEVEET